MLESLESLDSAPRRGRRSLSRRGSALGGLPARRGLTWPTTGWPRAAPRWRAARRACKSLGEPVWLGACWSLDAAWLCLADVTRFVR